MSGLHDIPDPDPLLPGIPVPWWAWGLVVILVIAVVATLLFIYSRSRSIDTQDSYFKDSRDALEKLRPSLPDLSLAQVATESSLVLRYYLVNTLREPALYETHEEFLLRSDALSKLPGGARQHLAPLLCELAAAKYGPSVADLRAANGIIDKSLEVLQGLESTRDRLVA